MMAEALLETVLQNLKSFIQNHAGLCLGFHWEMKKLSSTLSRIRALLRDAEQNKCQDEEIHFWQRKINCALYDVDDLFLNGCTILTLRYKNHSHSHCHAPPPFDDYVLNNYECSRKIGNKMNEITGKLEKIAEQIKFHLAQDIKEKPVYFSMVIIKRVEVESLICSAIYSALRNLKMAEFVDVNTPMYSDFAKEKIGMINGPNNNSGCSTNMHTSYLRRQEIAKGQIGTILGEAIPKKVEIVVVSKLYNNSSDGSTKIYSDGFTALNHRGISYGENIKIIIEAAAQVLTNQGGEFLGSYNLNETRIVPLDYDSNQWMSNKKKTGMILIERIDYCHSGWWSFSSMKKSTGRRVTAPRTPNDLPSHDEKSHVKSIVWPIRAWLLLIAALLATITYQVPFRMGRSSSNTSKVGYLQMNKQGSIMSRAFLLLINSMVFEISVVVTLFLLHKFPLKPWPQISILAMLGSYMYSMKEISPKESLALLLFISVAFTFLAAAAKLYTLKSKTRSFAVSGMV